jgi:hypothetical protein
VGQWRDSGGTPLILKGKNRLEGVLEKTKVTAIRGPSRKLTRRQNLFVRHLVSNDGLITLREAAIKAGYPPSSAHARAYELTSTRHCPHVVAEISRYRDELDEMYAVTYKRSERDLKIIRDAAIAGSAFSAATAAEVARGKLAGLYTSKSEVRSGSIDSLSRKEVELELDKIRRSFEPIVVDVTPTEVAEQSTSNGVEKSRGRPLAADFRRLENDES